MKTAGWLPLSLLLFLLAPPLSAQEGNAYKSMPAGHEKNKQLAASAHEANLSKHTNDGTILVLPGLIADRQKQRVEVLVETTKLGKGAACEFTIIGENSDHAYEALLISFARPSAVHQALQFIGQAPGLPADPEALRFWARGECFRLSVSRGDEPPVRLEKLLVDRRTGKTLPEAGFRFVGSGMVPAPDNPAKQVYAADISQPVAIVSLFNSPYSVLEVPYLAGKGEAYQNTSINPELSFPEGTLLTLIIEPANPGNVRRAKDLVLRVQAGTNAPSLSATGLERLNSLGFQLKEAATLLNKQPTLNSVVEALAPLDRQQHDYFLTVSFADDLDLGSTQALAKFLCVIDSDRGVRIEPPAAGQIYYRAFAPDRDLLNRGTRLYHPWELSLAEMNGVVSGKLLRTESIYKSGNLPPELKLSEIPVNGPQELRQALEAEAARTKRAGTPSTPPVMLVFAPAGLRYGQLTKFLEPALETHKTIYVYVDVPMPPLPGK